MNKNAPTPSSPGRGLADEPDDPGPSRAQAATGAIPEPELRIGGEAAAAIDSAWLRDRLLQVAQLLPMPVRKVNVQIVRDGRMTALHTRHMGVAETTDVLTFPITQEGKAGAGGAIEADIAVCVDEARWRADQYEHAVERELLLYVLHGLLHCAGYDDHDDAGFAAMHAEEDRILEAIGVGRTFAGREAAAAGQDAQPADEGSVQPDRGMHD